MVEGGVVEEKVVEEGGVACTEGGVVGVFEEGGVVGVASATEEQGGVIEEGLV